MYLSASLLEAILPNRIMRAMLTSPEQVVVVEKFDREFVILIGFYFDALLY
jgi:hypothetical protein